MPEPTTQRVSDWQIAEVMQIFGGSFVAGLGALFQLADPVNQERLKAAFPEIWHAYTDPVLQTRLAERRERRHG